MSLALSVLVLPACKSGANAEAVKLIPDEAEMIIGMNPKAISESELYKAFGSEMEKESDFKEAMSAFKDCGLEPKNIEAVVVGVKASSEDFVAIVGAEGIGKDETASCIIKNIQKMNGDEQVADVTKDSGHKIIQFTDGRAFLVNDNMLALATTSWEDKIGELIDGKGTPAIDNGKKDLYGKVDTKAAVWFLADVPSEMAGGAAMLAPEATKVKTVIGSLDFSKGLAVDMVAGFGSAELTGEENADAMRLGEDGRPVFLSNHAGGVLGGISTGQPLTARVAFKPTSSILTPGQTITRDGTETEVRTKGRHDPCVALRGVPVVEAMAACVLADAMLRHRAQVG